MKFNDGDKVRAIKPFDGQKPTGVGRVFAANEDHFTVRWDSWNNGGGEDSREWSYYQKTDALEIIPSAIEQISMGDYVEYTGRLRSDWIGRRGTVTEINQPRGTIYVRWDKPVDVVSGSITSFTRVSRSDEPKSTARWTSPFRVGGAVRLKSPAPGGRIGLLGRIKSVNETGSVSVAWDSGEETRYNDTAAKLHLEILNKVSSPTTKPPETAQELNVQLLTPIKVENQTIVTLPGHGRSKIEDLNNDALVGAIQQAEAQIEELKKLKHQPKVIKKQIADLEAGIKAIVDLLDTRFDAAQEKPAKKQGS